MTSVLMIDDEVRLLEPTARQLKRAGYDVSTATTAEAGLEMLNDHAFDIAVCDLRMPGMDGLEFQKAAKQKRPDMVFVLATAHGDDENVAEMFRSGGVDYLKKPFQFAELLGVIKRIEDTRKIKRENDILRNENQVLRQKAQEKDVKLKNIVAAGAAMQNVMRILHKVAPTDASVLLCGESGTGKEIIARALHQLSGRSDRIFLSINCGAIPELLLEAELFGHVKGAFTGAVETRKGVFETADGGTLFLDEVGEIPLHLQVKLLRVLQEGELQRVGDPMPRPVDVRVIAATNRDLADGVRSGWFRQDLFYRLNVIQITLPPLRERGEDLPLLIDFFRKKFANSDTKTMPKLSAAAAELLMSYPYPGNIRELENAIEHACVLCEKGQAIQPDDLPLQMQLFAKDPGKIVIPNSTKPVAAAPAPPADEPPPIAGRPRQSLEEMEIDAIMDALRRAHFNRTHAAQILGVTRRTLGYRIEKYDLEGQIEALKKKIENE